MLDFTVMQMSIVNRERAILKNGADNGAIVFVSSLLTNCCVTSVNPEFGATVVQRLDQSRVSPVVHSNLIAIKFGTAEARCLNWA